MKAVDTMKAVAVSADAQGMWENASTSWTSRTVGLLYERKHAIVATICNCSLNEYSCYASDQRLQWSNVDVHTGTKCALLFDYCFSCSVCAYLDTPCHSETIVVTCELIFTCSYCCRVQATKAVAVVVAVSADTCLQELSKSNCIPDIRCKLQPDTRY
jgi:hypothetical protein